jgi:hypothetical protein
MITIPPLVDTKKYLDWESRWEAKNRLEDARTWRTRSQDQLEAIGYNKNDSYAYGYELAYLRFPLGNEKPILNPTLRNLHPDLPNVPQGITLSRGKAREAMVTFPDDIGDSDNHREDVLWVYNHLSDADVRHVDAPSKGAWSLLLWARSDQKAFMTSVMPKVVAASFDETPADELDELELGVQEARTILKSVIGSVPKVEQARALLTDLRKKCRKSDSTLLDEIISCLGSVYAPGD